MLGDSAAAGLGAADPADTPGVVVARGLAGAARQAGRAAQHRGRRSHELRPRRPARRTARSRPRLGARDRRDDDRRQRRHPPRAPGGQRSPPRPGRTPAPRAGHRGRARLLPGPRHGATDPPPAAAHRPELVPSARRRPDDLRRRGRRPVGVPGRPPRPGVPRRPGGLLLRGPVPPLVPRLSPLRRGPPAVGVRRHSASAYQEERTEAACGAAPAGAPRGRGRGGCGGAGRHRGVRHAGRRAGPLPRGALGLGPPPAPAHRLLGRPEDAAGPEAPTTQRVSRRSRRAAMQASTRGSSPSPDAACTRSVPVTATWSPTTSGPRSGTVRRSAALARDVRRRVRQELGDLEGRCRA